MREWREWASFLVCLPFTPLLLEDYLDNRRYAAWKAAERQRRIDAAEGE
jgi:hypothetical protein